MKNILIGSILLVIGLHSFSQKSVTVALGGGSSNFIVYTTQTYTTGATVTISSSSNWLIFNPASVQSTVTITLPSTPDDREEVTISFGGTISGGGDVVTALTIAANSGQGLVQNYAPTYFQSGESITYKYNLPTLKWYAK